MERLVWIFTEKSAFTALVYPWLLEENGTTVWFGKTVRWEAFR